MRHPVQLPNRWRTKVALDISLRRLPTLSVVAVLMVLTGCSSWSQEGGIFEDKSKDYVSAKSSETAFSVAGTHMVYAPDALYPVPEEDEVSSGNLLQETPRVTSALMPLEQGAILLHQTGVYDRVLFSTIYEKSVEPGIHDYLERRKLELLGDSQVTSLGSVTSQLEGNPYVSGDIEHRITTQWAPAKTFGYDEPGFLKRLFGAERLEHQYAYFVSKPENSRQQGSFTDYTTQLHIAHRTRAKGSDSASPWSLSIANDDFLGLELVNFVEDLKREVALASAGSIEKMSVVLQSDGNGLPYLSIAERFPLVWEALIDVVPRQQWKVADLDRSKGVIYLEAKDDDALDKVDVKKFQLHLAEGPQVMILSVELDEEQPAGVDVGRHVLKVVEQKFSDKN